MGIKKRFKLIYAAQVKGHLQSIEKKYHSLIRRTIEEQLQFEPDKVTINRKPLKPPAEMGSDWEIRFGPNNRFRVFYTIEHEMKQVSILAVGIKQKHRLVVGGEEVDI